MKIALFPFSTKTHTRIQPSNTHKPTLYSFTMAITIDLAQRAMAQMENALKSGIREQNEALIRSLAAKHSFDAEAEIAALTEASITRKAPKKAAKKAKEPKEQKPKRLIPQMPLPWTGESKDDWCQGIRLNGGLHSQCTNEKTQDGSYCTTCQKGADKNGTGKPTYGDVEDRKCQPILEFRDSKGKQTVPMANLLEKSSHTREEIEAEAAKFGLTIPEEHWVKRVAKRGRPSKKSDGESSSEDEQKPKRKPGRPKKKVTVVQGAPSDDIIAKLVADAVSSDGSASDSVSSTASSSSDKRSQKARAKRLAKFTEEGKAEGKEGDELDAYVTKKETVHTAKLAKAKAKKAAKEQKPKEEPKAEEPKVEPTPAIDITISSNGDINDAPTETNDEVQEEEVEEESDGEGISVKPWTHPVTQEKYYKTDDGVVYDMEDSSVVGQWNEQTQEIEEIEDEDED